jgi:hypothetical protein
VRTLTSSPTILVRRTAHESQTPNRRGLANLNDQQRTGEEDRPVNMPVSARSLARLGPSRRVRGPGGLPDDDAEPMTEITSPARLTQSPTVIFIGSWIVNLEKGRATFTLFLGDTTLGAEPDLAARAVSLLPAISQSPINPDGRGSHAASHS